MNRSVSYNGLAMSDAAFPHPTTEELRALSLGQLTEADLSRVAAHLRECAECCRRIDQLATDDPLLKRLEKAASHAEQQLVPAAQRRSAVRALRKGQDKKTAAQQPASEPPPVILPAPKQVGEYDVLAEVGRGGMGVVYQARHRVLNRFVALKMVLAGDFASASQILRIRLEAELAARVQHPNIVQVYEIGTYEGRPFLALEWVDGGSLADRLDGTPWTPTEAARLIEILARATHAAHEQGVVHRDLKPANVLVGPVCRTGPDSTRVPLGKRDLLPSTSRSASGTYKITDFGLAQPIEGGKTLTHSGLLVGTPGYMAPEQASGKRAMVGPATDIYALGVMLYQLTTGQLPFQGDSGLEVLRAVTEDEATRPRRLQPDIPRDLEAITLHCLEKEPARRYPSALALAEDLWCFQQGKPIHARPVSRLERMRKWARRRPAVAALTLAVLGLVLLVTLAAPLVALREVRLRSDAESQRDKANHAQQEALLERDRANDAQQEALLERDKSRQLSANLALDKGVALAEAGQADRGLLWMLEALKTASPDAEGFQRMIRWNLGAWLGQVHRPLRFVDLGGPCNWCDFSPDGRSFAAGLNGGPLAPSTPIGIWDTASGRKLSIFPGAFPTFAFRPEGKTLIAYADLSHLMAIDLASGQELWKTPPSIIRTVAGQD
jgi:serine/threonine protein kinase